MEHEIRYFLGEIKKSMLPLSDEERVREQAGEPTRMVFKPSHLVTAVQLPGGAREIAVNTDNIEEKIEYILNAYDSSMALVSNPEVVMLNIMLV